MKAINETYRGHQIEIEDESFAIAGLETGVLTPKVGRQAVIRVDGDDVTKQCDTLGDGSGPEALLATARAYVDKEFFNKA